MDSEQIAKHEAAGCPLARELRVLRQMCSCQNDMASVDEAEARYLELRALEQPKPAEAKAEGAVAWEYRRSRDPGGWTEWERCNAFTHAEIQGGLWDNPENGRKWESRALYAEPPRAVPEVMVRAGTVRITPDGYVHISANVDQLRQARKAGDGAAVFVLTAAPRPDKENG